MPLAMAEEPPPLRRLLDEYVPFVIGSSPDSCGTGTLDNGRSSMDDICPALDANVVLTCPTFRSQSRTLLSQYVIKTPALTTLSTKGCLWATVSINLALTVSTQLYLRIYPSDPPLKTHRISPVAVIALIDVL